MSMPIQLLGALATNLLNGTSLNHCTETQEIKLYPENLAMSNFFPLPS